MANTSKRDLTLIQKAFEGTTRYEGDWREYERMYQSRHTQDFLDAAEEEERNAVFIPLTYSTVNIANAIFTEAFFADGNPIEVLKVGKKDDEKASELKRIVDYFYDQAKPYNELAKSFLSASMFGVGAVKVYWDKEQELPQTDMLPVTHVGFDQDAISRKDNKYIAHRFEQTLMVIQEKFNSGFYKCVKEPYKKADILGSIDTEPYSRKMVEELYSEVYIGGAKHYRVTTFIDKVLVREDTFSRCPIKHGHLMARLPSIDEDKRKNEIAAVGDSLVRIIKPLNEELNIKRNQRMDLIEKHINPDIWLPSTASVDEDDEGKMGGIKHCDSTAGILFQPVTGATEFVNDVMMLKNDIDDAVAVNGLQRGATSTSDRRSGDAMAMLNANSSPRLVGMIKMMKDTLFDDWAEHFVRLCYIHADDQLILEILDAEEHHLGEKGFREDLSINIKVNFGATINKQSKINDLISIVQMVGSNPNANVSGLIKKIIKLSLGENEDVEEILGVPDLAGNGEVIGGDSDQTADVVDQYAGGGGPLQNSGLDQPGQGGQGGADLNKIRSNQI